MGTLKYKSGLTLIEIIIVLAIFVIIILVGNNITSSLFSFGKEKILDKEMAKIKSELEEARVLTLASKGGVSYGIHFDTEQIVLFQGSSYLPNSPSNSTENIDFKVNISNVALTGGGNEVMFQKISGETNQSGNITIALKNDATKTRNILVTKTGLVIIK